MGLEPVSTIFILGTIAASAAIVALQAGENERKNMEERRRRMNKARRKKEEARRKQKQEDSSEQDTSEDEVERDVDVTYGRKSRPVYGNTYDTIRSSYTPSRLNALCECGSCYSEPPRGFNDWNPGSYSLLESRDFNPFSSWRTTETRPFLYDNSLSSSSYRQHSANVCECEFCFPENTRSRLRYLPSTENEEREEQRGPKKSIFETPKKQSVTITVTPRSTISNSISQPQQDKNEKKNVEQKFKSTGSNRGSSTGSSGSNYTHSNRITSEKSTSPAAVSGSGSQEPERNGNNKKDDEQKEDERTEIRLNDFIKRLKAVLKRCQCSPELCKKIMGFFNNFDKHKDNFIRLLNVIKDNGIKEEDVFSIIVQLFKSKDFAKYVTYGNFISLIDFVVKFIKDEVKLEIAAEDCNDGIQNLPFELQKSKSIERVVARTNIVASITKLFNKIREEITDDNTARPLVIDFDSIFSKVYHYYKHREVRGNVLTVKEYFDWVRKLLPLVMDLNPEYTDLIDKNHERREINFQMYLTVFHGRILIIVRVYGSRVNICTVYVKEKKEKNAKDGDKYVDGKKRT